MNRLYVPRMGLWLSAVFSLCLSVALMGCGGQRKDAGAENLDGIIVSDTAEVDSTPTTENQPQTENAPALTGTQKTEEVASTPLTNAAPIESDSTAESYQVQKGDTLMKIAFNTTGDISQWKDLYELNKDTIKNANKLEPGMNLKIKRPAMAPAIEKNGTPHLIKQGDTLGTIAEEIYARRSYWKKIYENNKALIKDPNKIYAGFYVYYQITEEERQWAESHRKAKLGSSTPAEESDKSPVEAAAASPSTAPPQNAQPARPTQAAEANTGTSPLNQLAETAPDSPTGSAAHTLPAAPPAGVVVRPGHTDRSGVVDGSPTPAPASSH